MLSLKTFDTGRIKNGAIYDFSAAGDVLEKHQHTEADNHITIVVLGSLIARGNGWERIISAGDVLDWTPNDPHEFESREPSRIVNIPK